MQRWGLTCGAALLALSWLGVTGNAEVVKFDFGRKDQPEAMEGFTPVTVYDDYAEAKGYGWIGVTGAVQAGWLEERAPLAGCLRSQGADDLSADYVAGGGEFGVKLPDGRYAVWMMVGDWGAYEFYPRGKYTVVAEGQVIGELDHSTYEKFRDDFWRHRDEEFVNGADLFAKYVEPRFRIYQAEVDVAGGRLEVQVRKDSGPGSYVGPLNALVAFPVSEKAAGEEELQRIRAARKAQFEKQFILLDMTEYYVGDTTEEEDAHGFAAWVVPYGSDIGLANRLPGYRKRGELAAMVSLGEMEPAVISVRPLKKDPGRFTCSVGPLVGDKGDVLPASALTVRTVKPWEMVIRPTEEMIAEQAKRHVELNRWSACVAALPYFLMERNWFEGQERVNRQFWLTVIMPETAASLTYRANVTIRGLGSEQVWPLTVTVIPVRLDRAKQAVCVNYAAPSYPEWFGDLEAEGYLWTMVEKDLNLMHDYGMTTVALLGGFGLPRPGRPEEENRWERFIRLYQKIGFERELVQDDTMGLYRAMPQELGGPGTKAWADAYEKVFRDYEAVAQRLRQKVIYSIGDETTNDGREALIRRVGEVAGERLGDVHLMSDINGYRELMALAPLLDAVGFNDGWAGSYGTNRPEHKLMTRDIIERVRSLGAKPWFINGGKGRYPYGIWFWKTTQWGQEGKIEWHYDASSADPYNPLDGTSTNDFGSLVLPEQVCTIEWELCREGVDDLRYLQRLDSLIAQYKDTQDPFLREAVSRASYVRDFWSDCVDDRFTSTGNPDGSGDYAGKAWPPERLNAMRREAAKMICMLEGKVVPGVYDEVAICDGDTGDQPERQLGGAVTRWVEDTRHATQGTHCFELTFRNGEGYADQWGRAPEKDWRGYRFLKLDIVNPQPRAVTITLNLRDQLAANLGGWELVHVEKLRCPPGKNAFVIPLVGMKSSNADHVFDMSCLFSFSFTTEAKQDTTVYVDNMRLCQR